MSLSVIGSSTKVDAVSCWRVYAVPIWVAARAWQLLGVGLSARKCHTKRHMIRHEMRFMSLAHGRDAY